ncbi:MAG: hypothetical protein SOV26_04830 [Candidatus Onthovivens sp.]|nr:hypothetical protein [Candidatus Onthovivens sp.]
MVIIKEVKTRKDIKNFILFPTVLYKNNPYYVPSFYGDEKKLFTKNNIYKDVAKHKFFLAYKDGNIVGRIQAIIQLQYNSMHNERRIRFGRFDCINDQEVANCLFDAVVKYGKEYGMDTLCGPLNYTDADREGLLIEGFDCLSTLYESYNFPYYQDLIENFGLKKEIDWFEFMLTKPSNNKTEKLQSLIDKSLKRQNLHLAPTNISKREYIKRYGMGAMNVLNEAYKDLYGVVPLSKKMQKQTIDQAKLIIKKEFLPILLDENDNVVGFGLCMPSLSKALNSTEGKLTNLRTLFRVLNALRNPDGGELLLVGLLPRYKGTGVNSVFIKSMLDGLYFGGLKFYETNLNLEYNTQVMSQWKWFNNRQHKKRRCYVKSI